IIANDEDFLDRRATFGDELDAGRGCGAGAHTQRTTWASTRRVDATGHDGMRVVALSEFEQDLAQPRQNAMLDFQNAVSIAHLASRSRTVHTSSKYPPSVTYGAAGRPATT